MPGDAQVRYRMPKNDLNMFGGLLRGFDIARLGFARLFKHMEPLQVI